MTTQVVSNNEFVSPITPRYRDVFYSSIPLNWEDSTKGCITCLPCGRDESSPPANAKIFIDGKQVN